MIEIEKPRIERVSDPALTTYGKFVVEPLSAVTLRRSFRRVLLFHFPVQLLHR